MTDHSCDDDAACARSIHTANADIFVTVKVAGLHSWPAATGARQYLRFPHRHIFGIKVETSVSHDDRQIEFHDLQDRIGEIVLQMSGRAGNGELVDFGNRSCEAIAREIGVELATMFKQSFRVTVDEDGECGATVDTVFV